MKKTMLYMIICLLCVSLANAQNNNPLNNSPDKDTIQEVFVDPVIHPKFPGGDEALMQYQQLHLLRQTQESYPYDIAVQKTYPIK